MALVPCFNCKNEISDGARRCPHCDFLFRKCLECGKQTPKSETKCEHCGSGFIECPECKKTVHEDEEECHNCGFILAECKSEATNEIKNEKKLESDGSDKSIIGTPFFQSICCPHCLISNTIEIRIPRKTHKIKCPNCEMFFFTLFAKIRSKKSKIEKENDKQVRHYRIRIYLLDGEEDFIEFTSREKPEVDFELRERDFVAFSSKSEHGVLFGGFSLIQNFTIGRTYENPIPACYIASCLYGEDSFEVLVLRKFRDNFLLKHYILRKLVCLYYKFSPLIVARFGTSETFRFAMRCLISPLTLLIRRVIKEDITYENVSSQNHPNLHNPLKH